MIELSIYIIDPIPNFISHHSPVNRQSPRRRSAPPTTCATDWSLSTAAHPSGTYRGREASSPVRAVSPVCTVSPVRPVTPPLRRNPSMMVATRRRRRRCPKGKTVRSRASWTRTCLTTFSSSATRPSLRRWSCCRIKTPASSNNCRKRTRLVWGGNRIFLNWSIRWSIWTRSVNRGVILLNFRIFFVTNFQIFFC